MSRAGFAEAPEVLGTLPASAVVKYLSRGVQTGVERPPQVALRKAATTLPVTENRWHTGPIIELLVEAMTRFDPGQTEVDGWLAPRLHATLRMSRGEAADSRLWNYLGMIVAPEYVVWRHRHGAAEMAAASRFSGPHYTQAFSRLWWAAELFRNGTDYTPVTVACRVQDVLNTTLRLDVIDHRPTAMAVIRVLEGLIVEQKPRLGDRVNALSAAVNTAGSTLVYDVIAPDDITDPEARGRWTDEAQEMAPVSWDRLPVGPDDGPVNEDSVAMLVPMFSRLLDEAPVRRRKKPAAAVE
jgi:hypothetical protein